MSQLCRICLKQIVGQNFIELEKDSKALEIRGKLTVCVPEISLDLVQDPVLCGICVNAINAAHDFKSQCLSTEQHIRSCLENLHRDRKNLTIIEISKYINGEEALPVGQSSNTTSVKTDGSVVCSQEQFEQFFQIYVDDDLVNENVGIRDADAPVAEKSSANRRSLRARNNAVLRTTRNKVKKKNKLKRNENSEDQDVNNSRIKRRKVQNESVHKSFNCRWCKYSTNIKMNLSLHIKSRHRNKKMYICAKCKYKTVLKDDYMKHLLIHSKKPFTRDKFKFRTAFKCNVTLHKSNDQNLCDCSTTDKNETITSDLKNKHECHIRSTSSNLRRFYKRLSNHKTECNAKTLLNCNVCDYETSFKKHFEIHMKIHDSKKFYECDKCGYNCATETSLKTHVKVHRNETLYNTCDGNLFSHNNMRTNKN